MNDHSSQDGKDIDISLKDSRRMYAPKPNNIFGINEYVLADGPKVDYLPVAIFAEKNKAK